MKKLGAYTLVRPLGRGGFGQTYLAQHSLLGTPACLKWAVHDWARPSLYQEAKVLWELHHASLAGVRDLWIDSKLGPIVAMRFVAGPALTDQPPKDAHQVLCVLGRLLRGLRVLHHRGIVHNDIKPANIILESGGNNPVLVDFGVASSNPKKGSQASGFTPLYVAPELVLGQTPTPQSDLYSLAMTMLEWMGADLYRRQLPPMPRPLLRLLLEMGRSDPALRQDPLAQISRLLDAVPA